MRARGLLTILAAWSMLDCGASVFTPSGPRALTSSGLQETHTEDQAADDSPAIATAERRDREERAEEHEEEQEEEHERRWWEPFFAEYTAPIGNTHQQLVVMATFLGPLALVVAWYLRQDKILSTDRRKFCLV